MNTGEIIKSKSFEKDPYTRIKNEILQNENLSWKARGLYCYLSSLPQNWVIYRKELVSRAPDGYKSMNAAFQELVEAGYITQLEIRNEQGHFKGYNYIVYDVVVLPEEIEEKNNSESPFLNI